MFRIKERIKYPETDFVCQDCGQKVWQSGISTAKGTIYLCGYCADEAVHNRELSPKNTACEKAWAKLVGRIFRHTLIS